MKKVKKHLFLLTVALVLIGCWIWKNQDKQEQIKADELNVIVSPIQTEIHAGDEYEMDITINKELFENYFYIELPEAFLMNSTDLIEFNNGLINNIEFLDGRWKVTLPKEATYPMTIKMKNELTLAGQYEVKISDANGSEKIVPIDIKEKIAEVSSEEKIEEEDEADLQPIIPESKKDDLSEQTDTSTLNDSEKEVTEEKEMANTTQEENKIPTESNSRANTPYFDWNLLNDDGLDLSTFKKVSVNTPVKLNGGVFDTQKRNYYMFLGHVGLTATYNYRTDSFATTGNMNAPINNGDNKIPLLSPMMIGVKKRTGNEEKQKIFSYDYDQTSSQKYSDANFDIGEMNNENGPVIDSGSVKNYGVSNTIMVSEYIKDNEIVAYGFMGRSPTSDKYTTQIMDYQPVRIHGEVVNTTSGRIKYRVSYINNSYNTKHYALTYGMHVDIGGAHKNSKLHSFAENGLYFNQSTPVPADKLAARIYFYMNNMYPDESGPTAIKVGNLVEIDPGGQANSKIAYWNGINKQEWLNKLQGEGYENPYQPWDQIEPVGYQYPLKHPVFALRWNSKELGPKEVGSGSLDLSIDEDAGEEPPSPVDPPISPKVQEEVFHEDGTRAETALPGEKLNYRTTVSNEGKEKDYNFMAFIAKINPNLENISNVIIKNESGVILGSGGYNEEKNRILTNSLKITSSKENIYFEYNATVKQNAKIDSFVKEKTNFQGSYQGEIPIAPIDSNEVETKIVKPKEIIEQVLTKTGEVAENAKTGESLHYITTLKGENAEIKNVADKIVVANPKSEMSTVTIRYIDENKNEIQESKVIRGQVGTYIDTESLKIPIIPGYDYESSYTWNPSISMGFQGVPGMFTQGDQEVENKYKKMTGPIKYKTLIFKQPLDPNLENPTNITLKTKDGSVIGEGHFNATDKVVEANLNQEVVSAEDILFEFDATVKTDVTPGVLVKGQTTVEGVYNTNAIFYKALSNEVSTMIIEDAGKLIFVSAPQLLDYGDDLKILTKDQKYSTQVKEDALIVQDSRGSGSEWSMRATLLESLSSDSNHELKDALHYYSNGQDYTFSVGDAIPIMDKKTTDSQPIDISSNWKGVEEGPVLDVKAGKPYAEKYSTSIQWTLQDVPGNG
ncbi:MucBP domain-containing protein [Carnobacterium divergens]|uniref:MucBP domain-containing protein n=1 Tax=Carnobacterium divergens TaxID=2748 RepID=UPI0039C9A8C7